jgi:hypothetical protein
MVDSPTNNFATLSPIAKGNAITLSEGNLKFTDTSYDFCWATQQSMDKIYFEVCQLTDRMSVGVVDGSIQNFDSSTFGENAYIIYSQADTNTIEIWNDNSNQATFTGLTIDTDGVLGIAIDFTTGDFYVWDTAGTAVNSGSSLYTFGTAKEWLLTTQNYSDAQSGIFNFGADSSFAGTKTAQANADENEIGEFYRSVPSGYLALCTDNLPDPEIKLPGDHFNTVLWSGDDTSPRSISGVGFSPDLVWSKARDDTWGHKWADSVRGSENTIWSNNTDAEDDYYIWGYLSAFDSDGFTITAGASGSQGWNDSTDTFVAWNWLAATTFDPDTAGTLTGSGRSNSTAGFSIVKYEGNGLSGATFGHGLSEAPTLVIARPLDRNDSWRVGSSEMTSWGYNMYLNEINAEVATSTIWNSTAPNATVVTIGNDGGINTDDENYIAYCFHSVEGYSKVGSFVGNYNADGTFIYLGFRPAFLVIGLFLTIKDRGIT